MRLMSSAAPPSPAGSPVRHSGWPATMAIDGRRGSKRRGGTGFSWMSYGYSSSLGSTSFNGLSNLRVTGRHRDHRGHPRRRDRLGAGCDRDRRPDRALRTTTLAFIGAFERGALQADPIMIERLMPAAASSHA